MELLVVVAVKVRGKPLSQQHWEDVFVLPDIAVMKYAHSVWNGTQSM